MKNKITVHAVLWGLLASINPTIAMNNNNNALILSPKDSPYSSPQLSPRNNNNDQLNCSSSSSNVSIPKLDLLRVPSYTSTPSSPAQSPRTKLSDALMTKASLDFFAAASDNNYYQIAENGTLTEKILDREQPKKHHYRAKLIIEKNQTYVKATHMIVTGNGPHLICLKDQPLLQIDLTKEQIATIIQDSLPQQNKKVIFGIDSANNQYCFNAEEPTDDNNSTNNSNNQNDDKNNDKNNDKKEFQPTTSNEPKETILDPNTGKGTSYTPTIIVGGCAFMAAMLGTLAILYKHNKLPNITELLNNFLSRVQNFRVTG